MPPKKMRGGRKQIKKKVEEEVSDDNLQDDEDLLNQNDANMPGNDQEDLTPEQRDEIIFKVLTSKNPQAPHNLTKFSWKDRVFKTEDMVDQLVFHYSVEGNILLNDSEEARDQEEYLEKKKNHDNKLLEAINKEISQELNGQIPHDGEHELKKSLRNMFNYQERTSQTPIIMLRERGIKTDPPQTSTFQQETTQWMIFDAFMQEYEDNLRQEAEEAAKLRQKDKKPQQVVQVHHDDPLYSANMSRCLKIMERMIVQNAEYPFFHDYKYYKDDTMDPESDSFGSVLPLWRFTSDKARKKAVTAICWNPRYTDMFAVSYGTYEFQSQTSGLICCFTIKNPNWPEFSFTTESGVMCIDFHPTCPALIAAGCYDGTVMVFDIRYGPKNKPIYQSTVRTCKHTDPVWQVRWAPEDQTSAKNLSFYSISSDGRVTNWNLMKNKLEAEEVMKLKLVVDKQKELSNPGKEPFVYGLAGGMCFDFNQYMDKLFLVGTEEGQIHLCSKDYSGQYLETYKDHYLAVYAVKWNPYHPKTFLSCSADWTIKMWMMDMKRPIVTYDLEQPVGDIAWAPYSSTVFAAVTSVPENAKLFIYDLDQNKHKHLCEMAATKKSRPQHVSFNGQDPIILVGDNNGGVVSFKLSDSLFRGPVQPDPEADAGKSVQDMEVAKLNKFLDSQDKIVY